MTTREGIFRHLIRRLFVKRIATKAARSQTIQLAPLVARLDRLESRLLNYYRNRWDAVDNLADYLVNAEVPGDYLEFGVFKGTTFSYAYKILSPLFEAMRFIAFDSFKGLPQPQGIDSNKGFSSGFFAGQFECSQDDFIAQLRHARVDMERVVIVSGWFDQTLTPAIAEKHAIEHISAAWIDCDLYESSVPVLRFITPYLSVGSVILFDDWRCYRNLPDFGEQRACHEWLAANPQISLRELFSFGFHGVAFTLSSC